MAKRICPNIEDPTLADALAALVSEVVGRYESTQVDITNLGNNTVSVINRQNLPEDMKALARANIGAAAVGEGGGTVDGAVLYTEQNLTEEQQTQARTNIGAATVADVITALPVYEGEITQYTDEDISEVLGGEY